ncbi:hypothetical protein HYS00_02560 [Candidatus Microgenomates bacterium]|nr:hypothetical protein [Candidatus Microgenomates bacterium]
MLKAQKSDSFASLFKKYRLRSEIETLSQFGDLLAQEGLVYENSLFTHWQKGDRIPKDRRLLLIIIEIFLKRGGITRPEEANKLLASCVHRDLEEHEIRTLFGSVNTSRTIMQADTSAIQNAKYEAISLRSLLKSKYTNWLVFLYVVVTIWHIRIWTLKLFNTPETDIVGNVYGLIALSSGFYMFRLLKHASNNSYNNKFAAVSKYLAFGLLSQWTGLVMWSFYTHFRIEVPYPSFADFGYFGLIPLYTIAAIKLLHKGDYYLSTLRSNKKFLIFFMPLIILAACYSVFLHISGFAFIRQVRVVLNASYPLGEVIPILIVMYILISPNYSLDKLSRKLLMFLVGAFFVQFVADYAFIYVAQLNQYVNGGYVDYIYASAYMIMNLVIIAFTNKNLCNLSTNYRFDKNRTYKQNNHYLTALPIAQLRDEKRK